MRGDLIQLYKIINKIDNIDHKSLFSFSTVTQTRGDKFKIYIQNCRTELRKNFFTNRVVKVWNKLSVIPKLAKDVNEFKRLIDIELTNQRYVFDE